jgi:hypothetical protein
MNAIGRRSIGHVTNRRRPSKTAEMPMRSMAASRGPNASLVAVRSRSWSSSYFGRRGI